MREMERTDKANITRKQLDTLCRKITGVSAYWGGRSAMQRVNHKRYTGEAVTVGDLIDIVDEINEDFREWRKGRTAWRSYAGGGYISSINGRTQYQVSASIRRQCREILRSF